MWPGRRAVEQRVIGTWVVAVVEWPGVVHNRAGRKQSRGQADSDGRPGIRLGHGPTGAAARPLPPDNQIHD